MRNIGRGKEGDCGQTGDAKDLDQCGAVRPTRKGWMAQILPMRSRQPVWRERGSGYSDFEVGRLDNRENDVSTDRARNV